MIEDEIGDEIEGVVFENLGVDNRLAVEKNLGGDTEEDTEEDTEKEDIEEGSMPGLEEGNMLEVEKDLGEVNNKQRVEKKNWRLEVDKIEEGGLRRQENHDILGSKLYIA